MTVLLANALISTSRSPRNAGTGISGPAVPNLVQQSVHIGPTPAEDFIKLPQEVALVSELRAEVDSGTDIQEGDYVTSITKKDGVTPWPSSNPNDTYHVIYIREGAPLLLPARFVYIKRVRAGGLPTA
jgi:hypothetical protein